jgi:hypothetical protein
VSETTIPRAKLLELIDQLGQPGSAALVDLVMNKLGWQTKQHFTKTEFTRVMEGVAQWGIESMQDPEAAPGASEEDKADVAAMLQSLKQNALPLIRRHGSQS